MTLDRAIVLDYERFMSQFLPTVALNDSNTMSRFVEDLGRKLTEIEQLDRYTIEMPDREHLKVQVCYLFKDHITDDLVDKTTKLLNETMVNAGIDEKRYFVPKKTRMMPLKKYKELF